MRWISIPKGQKLQFEYTNWKGNTAVRNVEFVSLQYGCNEWYPAKQWFMHCWDHDKDAMRSFALAKIDVEKLVLL